MKYSKIADLPEPDRCLGPWGYGLRVAPFWPKNLEIGGRHRDELLPTLGENICQGKLNKALSFCMLQYFVI
tara:strand:+ start:256 stop:468 length:213 start_codon:yes stop_codon:yes gene_type:complete